MIDKILKILINSARIVIIMMIRYSPLMAKQEFKKLIGDTPESKIKRPLESNDLSDWRRIGKVSTLHIYPVKSSAAQLFPRSNSYNFFDFGMCKSYRGECIYDGMFIVYNQTKDKFVDVRTYPSLTYMAATETENTQIAELKLNGHNDRDTKIFNIHHNRLLGNTFRKETWNGQVDQFFKSNLEINEWVRNVIDAAYEDDITLAQMIPNLRQTSIRNNWHRFVQGYYETTREDREDDTGKLITLPRFVLMTEQTRGRLSLTSAFITPNVVIDVTEIELNPFEETNWTFIKLGENVILKNVTPVPRDENLGVEYPHCGIYCGLWKGGKVSTNDDVFLSFSDESSPNEKLKLPRI